MDTILQQPPATTTAAKPAAAIGAIFGATPGMPGLFKSNFDYQLVRGMLAGAYGEGGAFGELVLDGTAGRGQRCGKLDCRMDRHRRAGRNHSP